MSMYSIVWTEGLIASQEKIKFTAQWNIQWTLGLWSKVKIGPAKAAHYEEEKLAYHVSFK